MYRRVIVLIFFILFFVTSAGAALTAARIQEKMYSFGFESIPNLVFNGDYGLRKNRGIGASLGLFNQRDRGFLVGKNTFLKSDETTYFEMHATYMYREFTQDLPFYLGFLGGIWGTSSKLSPQLGVLLEIPLAKKWITRFNLIYGPRAGVEIAWLAQKNIEFCVDIGYAAGFLGGRIYF